MIASKVRTQVNSWVSVPQPLDQARIRLFCFPYAGGSSLIYRKWPEELPNEVEVLLLQLPGRGSRLHEPPFTQLDALVQAIGESILPYLNKPFAFFGHSMGALISFELARYLRRVEGPTPAQLFLSGRTGPQILDADPPTYDLPEDEFLEELRRLNGTPLEVLEHPELMKLMIPLLRADFSVCQTHAHKVEPPLSCPITAFGGLKDHEIPRESLEAWREHTAAEFKLRMLPGDHFFLNSDQPQLLRIVAQELYHLVRKEGFGVV
jgi:medium-chain acyl-[acyl-carrier-protein] hydrolase